LTCDQRRRRLLIEDSTREGFGEELVQLGFTDARLSRLRGVHARAKEQFEDHLPVANVVRQSRHTSSAIC
jgi:hypothetical protein